MTIKKSLIATAVAGALVVPMAAQAGGYGRLAIGINVHNEDATAPGEDDLDIADVSSYFGFRGEDDLGNGMTAFFDYQFDVRADTGAVGSGDTFADPVNGTGAGSTRQSHIGLRGDFGAVRIGKSTDPFYEHVGVLTDWGWWATAPTFYSLPSGNGLYLPDSLNYRGGSGPVSFSAAVQAVGGNDEDFDQLFLGGTFDFGQGTVSLAHQSESNAAGPEPSTLGIGATFDLGEVGLRGAYYAADPDTGGAEPSGFDLLAHSSFGGGLSGYVGVSLLDADTASGAGDTTSFWGNITRSLSSRTSLFAEALVQSVDGGAAADTDPTTLTFGAVHTF